MRTQKHEPTCSHLHATTSLSVAAEPVSEALTGGLRGRDVERHWLRRGVAPAKRRAERLQCSRLRPGGLLREDGIDFSVELLREFRKVIVLVDLDLQLHIA